MEWIAIGIGVYAIIAGLTWWVLRRAIYHRPVTRVARGGGAGNIKCEEECELCFYVQSPGTERAPAKGQKIVGHTWIGLKCNGNEETFGFYPDGLLNPEPHADSWDCKTCFIINQDECEKVKKVIEKWESEEYYILEGNCTDFIKDVAQAAGIELTTKGIVVAGGLIGFLATITLVGPIATLLCLDSPKAFEDSLKEGDGEGDTECR